MPQKPYLFSGTVARNLRYADPDATDEELWEALEIAQAADFVRAMPDGLDVPIAQGGTNVSGGQRQRLAIARALVRRPGIYLFDDSFSALDLATDARLRAALAPVAPDAAVLVVAQRVSTILEADQILVLEDGALRRARHPRRAARRLSDLRRDRRLAARPAGGGMSDSANAQPAKSPARRGTLGNGRALLPQRACPREKSKDFQRLRPAAGLASCGPSAAGRSSCSRWPWSASRLSVLGPRLLGTATNIIVDGVLGGRRRRLREARTGRSAPCSCSTWSPRRWRSGQACLLAGVVQRTMQRLRADVEEKLHRLPLGYVDRQPRGDLLSRVTNDIDNVAQSLQQTLSQMLTSTLTLVGVVIMMFTISPLLALDRAGHHPGVAPHACGSSPSRSKKRFIAQWSHTGALNAQVEEAFTGHSLVKVFGRSATSRQRFDAKNEELYEASFGAQFISGIIQPAMMFLGNLNYVVIAVVGGLRVSSGSHEHRRHAGLHPVLAPVHPAAHPAGVDGQRAAVGHRLGRAGLRAARRSGGARRRRPSR